MENAEAIRLLHKFSPTTKRFIHCWKDCNLDNIYDAILAINNLAKRKKMDSESHSAELFKLAYRHFNKLEKDRVLVIPDAGSYEIKPFVCAAKSLLQRIKELDEPMQFLGSGDTVFCFETTGNILYFDHHEHYVLALS